MTVTVKDVSVETCFANLKVLSFSLNIFKVDPFARANSARACSDCLVLTELTRLGKAKCLYGEKLARRGG